MTRTAARLVEGKLVDATNDTLYTSPAATQTQVVKLSLTNTTGTDKTIDIWLVPASTAVADRYKIADTLSIRANKTVNLASAEGQVLDEGGTIVGNASVGSSITAVASGVQIT